MSKDVVIAGVIVAACLGLVVVAFTLPKKAPRPVDSSESNSLTSEGSGGSPTLPGDTTGTGTLDSYGSGSTGGGFGSTTPDSSGLGSTTTPGYGSTSTPDASGYGSTTTPGTGGYGSTTTPGLGSTTTPGTGGFGSTTTSGFGSTTTPGIGGTETTTPVPTGEKTHVVAKGETLGDISMKYYGTSKHWKKIKEANSQIDPSNMQVGTKLTIPEVAAPAATDTSATGTPVANDRSYKIKAGDTYYSIAKHELGSAARWKEIERLNKLAPEDLRVGMSIKLPAKEKDPVVSTPGAETGTGTGTATDPTTDTSATGKTHVVAAGETLGDISKKYYGTTTKWREIAKANAGIEPEAMKVGQKLVIPEIAGVAPAAGTAPTTDSGAALGGAEYVVKGGDTLESIALSQLGKKSEAKKILEANPGVNPRKLRIGQKLVIPGKAAAAESVPAGDSLPAPLMPLPGAPLPNPLPPAPGGPLPDFNFGNPSRLGDGTGASTLPPPVTPGSNPTM